MANFTGLTGRTLLLPFLASFLVVQGAPLKTSLANSRGAKSAQGRALPKLSKGRLSTPAAQIRAGGKSIMERAANKPKTGNKVRAGKVSFSRPSPAAGGKERSARNSTAKGQTPSSRAALKERSRGMAKNFKWPRKIAMLTASFAAGIYASIFLTNNYDPHAPATTEIKVEADDIGGQVDIGGDRSPVRVTDQ